MIPGHVLDGKAPVCCRSISPAELLTTRLRTLPTKAFISFPTWPLGFNCTSRVVGSGGEFLGRQTLLWLPGPTRDAQIAGRGAKGQALVRGYSRLYAGLKQATRSFSSRLRVSRSALLVWA